jgi:hypothetical protein
MNCNNYEDKIISYIENELTAEERAQFKSELDSNPDLRVQYDEMRNILISLNKMPKAEAFSDFMVKLNLKIDNHESKSTNKIGIFFNKIINYDYFPQVSVGIASLVCLFIVTYFWSPNNNGSQIMLSNSSSVVDSIDHEIANLDSLDDQDALIILDK